MRWPWVRRADDLSTTFEVPFDTTASAEARHRLVDELMSLGASDELLESAELVLGELVANAVRHGRPTVSGCIEVQWRAGSEGLTISVRDGGTVDHLEAGAFTLDAFSGRGLAIVEQLSTRWDVEHQDGVRVSATLAGCT